MERVSYKEHPVYCDYLVGSDGSVWSTKHGQIRRRKPSIARGGYLKVDLQHEGRQVTELVHRLVLETHVGACPEGMECRHIDGKRTNNAVSNLAWGTHSENLSDRVEHGTVPVQAGHHNYNARLSVDDVEKIRHLYFFCGLTQKAIADMCGVSQGHVSRICKGIAWSHCQVPR